VSEHHTEGGRILLVEDLAIHRRMLPLRLGPLGREVVAVADTAAADIHLASATPDLILLDVVLPGKDGFTYCRELKANPDRCDIPVMILSDLTTDVFSRAMDAGADDHLSKRIDDSVLRIRTRLHLQLRSQRKGRPGFEPASILMLSPSAALRGQIEAQANQDGHRIRFAKDLEGLDQLGAEDHILIIDIAREFEGLAEALISVRTCPDTQNAAVLLVCEKVEFPLLQTMETMVDDVVWKPLKAQATRHRLRLLAELAQLNRD